ncbi:MAG: cation diffusion facilitator family transporter, partial [Burkholderiales bacterium]
MSAHHGHSHAHGHSHDHEIRPPAFVTALAITLGYAFVELVGGLWSGSLALTSDAGHMFSDALALALAAVAAWLARRPPGVKHSYGLARAEVIGATLNGLMMLAIIVVLVVEAGHRLRAPQPVSAGVVMAIAGVGLLVNAGVAYVLSRGDHDLNVRA